MTNHWADIGNATLVIAMGANPTENHPACMAHVNRARTKAPKTLPNGTVSNKPAATMIVIDPRKTRTALQADRYIRIRPGTDIAFDNAVVKSIITTMEAKADGDPAKGAFFGYLNQGGADTYKGTFFTDGGAGLVSAAPASTVPFASKYTDARFVVAPTGTDYDREKIVASTGLPATTETGDVTISNYPKRLSDCRAAYNGGNVNTVYERLKAHVAPYSLEAAAAICGCTAGEIKYVADQIILHSRCSSLKADGVTVEHDPTKAEFRSTTYLYAMGLTQHTYGSQNVKALAVIQTLMGNMGRCGGGINALRGIHNVQGSTDMGLLYGNIPAYSGNPTVRVGPVDVFAADGTTLVESPHAFGKYMDALWGNPLSGAPGAGPGYAARQSMDGTYADAYNTGAMALQQRGFFNMTLKFFGGYSQALAITDPALRKPLVDSIYGLWPKGNGDNHIVMFRKMGQAAKLQSEYSKKFSAGATGSITLGFNDVISGDAGKPVVVVPAGGGTPFVEGDDYSVDYAAGVITRLATAPSLAQAAQVDVTYYPHGITAACVWGQNPANTEPNQSKVREGLKNLDLLVTVDMFETETTACDRKVGGITYLIPTAAHVEKAGSVTNSGRTLQWRYQSVPPSGNTKDDNELLLRFAKALDDANAFSHIEDVWAAQTPAITGSVYSNLYGTPYGWTPGVGAFDDATEAAYLIDYATLGVNASSPTTYAQIELSGSEFVAERVYREMCQPGGSGGTIWIYVEAYDTGRTGRKHTGQADWATANRAKSRSTWDGNNILAYPGWGYSWLVNRRVFYNNSEVPGDVGDFYMGPDSCSRLFVSTNTATLNYSRWYRTIHRLSDKPDVVLAGTLASPHFVAKPGGLPTEKVSYAGRFPAHTEPYETPREDVASAWGRNTKGTAAWDLVPANTPVAGRGFTIAGGKPVDDPAASTYPLVLTTIRCVEHFQGGPITRNNAYNHEAEPEPWIELTSYDAYRYAIRAGDYVRIITARTDGLPGDVLQPYGQGFKARIGAGVASNQRVGKGVVAIPWHWGEQGLSTGSRANDLTIDAMDANTTIPEYKACLCRIERIVP